MADRLLLTFTIGDTLKKLILILSLFVMPLALFGAHHAADGHDGATEKGKEHAGEEAKPKEHGGKAAKSKEHGGKAAKSKED